MTALDSLQVALIHTALERGVPGQQETETV